jgi:hypothetical protein
MECEIVGLTVRQERLDVERSLIFRPNELKALEEKRGRLPFLHEGMDRHVKARALFHPTCDTSATRSAEDERNTLTAMKITPEIRSIAAARRAPTSVAIPVWLTRVASCTSTGLRHPGIFCVSNRTCRV